MGLDSVELILEVEDRFDVRIPDDMYVEIRTVGDLFDYLNGIKHFANDGRCASIGAFLETRRTIATLFAVPAMHIRPRTSLSSVIPRANRRHEWRRFAEALNIELPPLSLPSWLKLLLLIFGASVAFSSFVFYTGPLATAMFLAFAIVAFATLMSLSWVLSFRFAVEIPSCCLLVRDVAFYSLLKSTPKDGTSCALTRSEAWKFLQSIICEQLAISPSQVHRNATFVDDLGLN